MKKILSIFCFSLFFAFNISLAEENQDYTEWATVISVYDGDTFTVLRDNELEQDKIRTLGIDTPEIRSGSKSTCLGDEAAEYAKNYLERRRVLLIRDSRTNNRDSFGRLLRYVRVEGKVDIGKKLILEGFASVYEGEDFKWKRRYTRYQNRMIERNKGIWGDLCNQEIIESYNTTDLETTPTPLIQSSEIWYDLSDGPVKKSHRSGTCHTEASRSFSITKKFDWYDTMEDCLNSGGKPFPK